MKNNSRNLVKIEKQLNDEKLQIVGATSITNQGPMSEPGAESVIKATKPDGFFGSNYF